MSLARRASARAVPTATQRGEEERATAAARLALLGLFFVNGLTLSLWIARVPAVRDSLGLAPAELGRMLLAAALGGLVATTVAPAVTARLGLVAALRASAVVFAVGYVAVGVGAASGSLALVAGGLLLNGVAFSGGNLPLNLGSTDVERRLGRSVLPHFHAAFSIGTVTGALVGAAVAALAVPLLGQFLAMAVAALAWRWVAAGAVLPQERALRGPTPARRPGRPQPSAPGTARPRGGLAALVRSPVGVSTLLIGVVALVAGLSEGAANDWVALGVVDGFGAGQSTAAIAFGVFVGAMTLVRLAGTRLIDRFGRALVLRAGAVVSIVGILVYVTAPSLPLALVGIGAWGAGAALNFPIAISAASDDPRLAGVRVSVMAAFGALSGFVGPTALGALGGVVGVRTAMLAVAVALLAVLGAAVAVHRARPTAPEATAPAPTAPAPTAPDASPPALRPTAPLTEPVPVLAGAPAGAATLENASLAAASRAA